MKQLLALVLFVGMATGTAKADILNISAGGTFHTDNLGIEKFETFHTSLDWDTVLDAIVPNTLNMSETGPLTGFTLSTFLYTTFPSHSIVPVFDWFDGTGDLIQLHLGLHETDLYHQHPTSELGLFVAGWDPSAASSYLTISPVNSPEPGLLTQLALGLVAMALLYVASPSARAKRNAA